MNAIGKMLPCLCADATNEQMQTLTLWQKQLPAKANKCRQSGDETQPSPPAEKWNAPTQHLWQWGTQPKPDTERWGAPGAGPPPPPAAARPRPPLAAGSAPPASGGRGDGWRTNCRVFQLIGDEKFDIFMKIIFRVFFHARSNPL